jgi:hypothetical protein
MAGKEHRLRRGDKMDFSFVVERREQRSGGRI